MPLWIIYHPEGTFEDATSRQALAAESVKQYTDLGLPAFYVVTQFIKMPKDTMFSGGKAVSDLVRVVVEHIAVRLPNEDEVYKKVANTIDAVLKKHIGDKGFHYEFHVDETEKRLWKVDGMFAPEFGSDEEKIWFKENRAVDLGKQATL
ncbi:hypothetical protein ACET3X_005543 [Alternaria dauci]|uniref:Tautomerase cis-CaaD-like domain-containing protein n=1 Tax=Alternaria dauci TaxID=48095 RepID=A0ABR3UKK2_9PLEO